MIDFTLTYDGPLPSGGKSSAVETKQAIRRQLHPQLEAWWKTGQLAATLESIKQNKTLWDTIIADQFTKNPFSDFSFLPIVPKFLDVVCSLDVLFLRPEEPGNFIKNDGDIDNRLKVLFDALRMPKDRGEIPAGDTPQPNEKPRFYCLLEDDSLITKVTVRAQRLLVLNPDPSTVRLVIDVILRAKFLTNNNFAIGT
jgi:hypothetical protein